MKKFIIKLAAVTGIIVIIAGISALATEFSLVTLAIVFAAIITENALCGAYLDKNKHSKKYVYRKYNIYHNNNIYRKACAQRTLYRHRRDKTGDVMTERNIREANIAFRKGWPVNIICGLDGVRYNIDDYPYSKKEEARIVDAILAIRDTTVTDYLLKHYKDGIKYSDMAYAENKSKQNAHGFGRRRLAYVRNILRTKGLLKGPKTTK